MKRILVAILCIVTITICLYVLLYFLALARIDPTIYVAAKPRQYHADVVLSPLGIIIWSTIIAMHSLLIALFASFYLKQRMLWRGFTIFVVTLLFITIIHPTFLMLALPESIRQNYFHFVERYIPPLYQIYFHWGLGKYVYSIFAIHISLLCALVLSRGSVVKLRITNA